MRFILTVIWLMATVATSIAQDRPVHVVSAGETLFAVSRRYQVPVENLRSWNNLTRDGLVVGQRLFVGPPVAAVPATDNRPSPPATGQPVIHRVAPGETLFAISRRYGVTVAEITDWNNLSSTTIETGQELRILRSVRNVQETRDENAAIVSVSVPSAYYVVRRGDALGLIAERFGTTVDQLREWNKLRNDRLAVGQVLLVRQPEALPAVGDASTTSGPQGRFVQYEWKRNDTPASVAGRNGMTEAELRAINPETDFRSIRVGNRIIVLLAPTVVYRNPYAASRQDPNSLGFMTPSVYAESDAGKPLTSGDLYEPGRLTAGHNTIPLGSVVYVENTRTGTGVYVLVNDRILEAELRLSKAAFDALGLRQGAAGTVQVYDEDFP